MKPVLLAMAALLGVLWIRLGGNTFAEGTYTNRDAGFAVELPAGFVETDVPFSTFAVADASNERTCVVLVQDVPAGIGAQQLMEHAEKRGRGAGYARLSYDPTTVGGVAGFRSESRMQVGGSPFRNTELHLVREGTAVSVQCLAPEQDFDAHYLDFSRALGSFRWLD